MYVTEYKHKEYGWQITKDGRFIPLVDIDMNTHGNTKMVEKLTLFEDIISRNTGDISLNIDKINSAESTFDTYKDPFTQLMHRIFCIGVYHGRKHDVRKPKSYE